VSLPAAWLRRGWVAHLLWPLSQVLRALAALQRSLYRLRPPYRPAVPVVVVGNWIVGGAGKTPTLLMLLALLQAWGLRVGVVSRGYGRRTRGVHLAGPHSDATQLGDEPLLIHRRTGAPLAVGERRAEATAALLAAHPDLHLVLSDDGLQHHALARDLTVLVFDRRGLGNGWLLPAGPLRQDRAQPPLPGCRADTLVLYSDGIASTPLPGFVAQRRLGDAWPLAAWWSGDGTARRALSQLGGRPVWAAAGLAQPERFFDMLREHGLVVQALPLPDHADWRSWPWPADAEDVLVTEKDAVKLPPERLPARPRVWVVPLDLQAPPDFERALREALTPCLGPTPPAPHPNGSPHGPTTD
jgi:tetraacyldisaccharide 4'-kinase